MAEQHEILKNISNNQHEILYNIMHLHNNGDAFDCDITYSCGNFYKQKNKNNKQYIIPQPKYKFDVYPQFDDVKQLTPFEPIPLDDDSIDSIVIDLPFVISPQKAPSMTDGAASSNRIARRFSSFYPVNELLENYYWWLKEAYRVLKPKGICVFKCQSTVTGGKMLMSAEYSWLIATMLGFDVADQCFLWTKQRLLSGKIKKQQHFRKYTSCFYVFKKCNSKKPIYLDWADEELRTELIEKLLYNTTKKCLNKK